MKGAKTMSEHLHCVMDETDRPFEPGDPRYDEAMKDTPEDRALYAELIKEIGLCEKKEKFETMQK